MSMGAGITRLRKHAEFSNAFANGKSVANKILVLYSYRRSEADPARFGYSVSKRVGNAVIRNRVKRRLQSIMREVAPTMQSGYDYVWIARNRAAEVSFDRLKAAVLELVKR